MIINIKIAHWRFTFTLAPVTNVTGVNSKLADGNHIIMWDFDDIQLDVVKSVLGIVQSIYDLPTIYILNTGAPNHFIAYCFARCEWRLSIEIVAATPHVDPAFFKYGVYREHWTLRVTPKEGRKPKLIALLYSKTKEEANVSELNSWVKDTLKVQDPKNSFLLHYSESSSRCSAGFPRQRDVSANNTRHSPTQHQ